MSEKLLLINPHASRSTSFVVLFRTIFSNLQLIFQMTRREVLGRYKGSVFGLVWSLFNPILMLTIYTFVFAVIFKARWAGTLGDSKLEFALILFVGIAVYTILADSINQSPSLITNNSNYVKRVVFPLEILPFISMGSTLFHIGISFMVLIAGLFLMNGFVSWTIILLPLVLLPLIIFSIGISWFLASLGVFIPDIRQATGIFSTALMFLSPIFYPVSALPERIQQWAFLNPLTFIIEQARAVLVFGVIPDWRGLFVYGFFACCCAWLGFVWFQKTRKGFADVL